jgi:hypothetical protein
MVNIDRSLDPSGKRHRAAGDRGPADAGIQREAECKVRTLRTHEACASADPCADTPGRDTYLSKPAFESLCVHADAVDPLIDDAGLKYVATQADDEARGGAH